MRAKSFLLSIIIVAGILCLGLTAKANATEIDDLIAQLQAQIQEIMQRISALQAQQQSQVTTQNTAQNGSASSVSGSGDWCHTFSANLGYANSGISEVGYLHTALTNEGISFFPDTGNTYSVATARAVQQFQLKYGISGSGYFGPSTKAKMNAIYACAAGTISMPNVANTNTVDTTNTAVICTTNWFCTNWSACANGVQTKTCTDLNNCGTTNGKPSTTQSCVGLTQESVDVVTPVDDNYIITPSIPEATVPDSCQANWSCANWSACSNGVQTKTCTDLNGCADDRVESQQCGSVCTPRWTYTAWSACSNGVQTRTVTDLNSCGVNTDKPANSQSCTEKSITITSPTSGDAWQKMSKYNIKWTSMGVSKVNILMQGATQIGIASNVYALNGLYAFAVPSNIPDGNYNIVIYDSTNSSIVAKSSQFTIGSLSCTPSWFCTPWGICSNNMQARTCSDVNYCGTTTGKPAESQSCTITSTCTDTDGDMDIESSYYVYGTVQTSTAKYEDSCTNDATLYERYCSSDKNSSQTVSCQYGCWNGKCNQESEARAITLLYPNGGETLQMGQTYQIHYLTSRLSVKTGYPVQVYLERSFKNGGADYIRLGSTIDASKFSFNTANFSSFVGDDFSIRVCSWDGKVCDRSDDYFSIESSVAKQGALDPMVASFSSIFEQFKQIFGK